jgi:hypothetical protein
MVRGGEDEVRTLEVIILGREAGGRMRCGRRRVSIHVRIVSDAGANRELTIRRAR